MPEPLLGSHERCFYDWSGGATGAVYLLRCELTGVFKVGASVNPFGRIRQLVFSRAGGKWQFEYVWSVATNHIARVERYWCSRWKRYRVFGREWLRLPADEVQAFRRFSTVVWKDLPAPDPVWWECVNAPFRPTRRMPLRKKNPNRDDSC